jgi:hypothetical protein
MKGLAILLVLLCIVALPRPGLAEPEKLGNVGLRHPATRRSGRLRARRGLLHSYWFAEARKAFGPSSAGSGCVMAYWGLAVNYLGNSLASARHRRTSPPRRRGSTRRA